MIYPALLIVGLCFGVLAEAGAQPGSNSGGYQGAVAPADNALFEVLSRIEQLQSEVQQLRGVVEEQAQTIADLERKQRNMYTDLDGRVQALVPAAVQNPAPQPPAISQPAPVAAAQPPVPVAAAAAVAAAPAPVSAPEVKPTEPAVPAASNKGNQKERYQAAYDTLRNGHNEQAIREFESLLVDFPGGELADNAQYWLAEAYKINRENDKARSAFAKVVSLYPNSSKVPDALLKIGYIEFDLQNTAKAKDYLNRVINGYPGTTAAHLAAKKLAQLPQ